ncbi:MAG: efflux RND transporter periplasmic adaptor subunit [Pirellula sp.]|nr:efflux RND transporter periplasmic adaptor subunit [Pirellula sp.]
MKRLGPVLTAFLLAMFLSSLSMAYAQESVETRHPENDRVLTIEGAILKTIEATSLAAQVSGLIDRIEIKEGSRVVPGQELAFVRDAAVRTQMDRSRIALELARKKSENDIDEQVAVKSQAVAANEYQRAIDANQKVSNVYPPSEMDRLKLILDRSVLETARAAYQRDLGRLEALLAEAELKVHEELLQRHRVIAPCHGLVVAVEKRVGEWVEPGVTVVRLVEIDRLRIEGFLLATDATKELLGKTAKVTVGVAGQSIEKTAELVFISPEANPVNGQVRVFLEVDNRQGDLRPGLRPTVTLHVTP